MQVPQQGARRAVAGVRVGREGLPHQAVEGRRDAGVYVAGRGNAGRAGERRHPGQHLIEGGAQCEDVAGSGRVAGGEFGREVGQPARLAFAGRDDRPVGKIGGLDLPFGAEEDVAGPQIAVRGPSPVGGDEGFGDRLSNVGGDGEGEGGDTPNTLLERDAAQQFADDVQVAPLSHALAEDAQNAGMVKRLGLAHGGLELLPGARVRAEKGGGDHLQDDDAPLLAVPGLGELVGRRLGAGGVF